MDYAQLESIYYKASSHPYFVKAFTKKDKFVPPLIEYLKNVQDVDAFATNHANNRDVVQVTQGCLDFFDRDEILFILGHELTHHVHKDHRARPVSYHIVNCFKFMGVTAIPLSLLRAGVFNFPVFLFCFVVISGLFVAYWYSKTKTYWHRVELRADLQAAKLFGYQPAINALLKFEVNRKCDTPDGLESRAERWRSYFAVHPTFDARIKQLQTHAQMEGL